VSQGQLKKNKNAADRYWNQLLPISRCPSGYQTGRVSWSKKRRMCPIPIHLWGSPILHDELGLVKDWLTRLDKFADCQVEIIPTEEVELREHLIIRTNDLEDLLLLNSEELQPKESIKEIEKHLA
jgi:hypothetical protein